MTYEPYEKGGMKITVSNPSKPEATWSYVTMFDGKFRPVTGQQGSETAVEIINAKSIRIYNKRNGVVNQVVINTLSEDNNKISNEYIRMDKDGKITGVTHVTYIRRKKWRSPGGRSHRPPQAHPDSSGYLVLRHV